MKLAERKQKNQKNFLILKITAFEWGMTNSHNPEYDTCHWETMCYKTHLRFSISLREIFPNQVLLACWKNMMKVLS